MKFPWLKIKERKAGAIVVTREVPAILITFINGDRRFRCYGLVDSGADETILPGVFARELGIDIRSGEEKTGVGCGGDFTYYSFAQIKINVGGDEFDIPVSFVETDDQPPLLGLSGIFQRYKVVVDSKKKLIELKPFK